MLIFVPSLKILDILSYKERGHIATTFLVAIAFPIKEKWSAEKRNRKEPMEVPKEGGARKSERKVLVTK